LAVEGEIVGVAKSVGDQFSTRQIGLEPQQHTGPRLLDRRCRQGGIGTGDLGKVPGDHIPPAVGALLNRMGVVFAAGLEAQE